MNQASNEEAGKRTGAAMGCLVVTLGLVISLVSLVITAKFLDKAEGPIELYGSMCVGFILVPVLFVSVPITVLVVSSSKRQVRELLERGDDDALKELFNLAFPATVPGGGNSYALPAIRENMGMWNRLFALLFDPDTKIEQSTMAVRVLGSEWYDRVVAALGKKNRCQRAREILLALEWEPGSAEERQLWKEAEKLAKAHELEAAAETKRRRDEILKGPPEPISGITFHCAGCKSIVQVNAPGQGVTCKGCRQNLRVPKRADCPQCHSEKTSFSTKQGAKLAAKFAFGIIGGIVTENFACFYCQECGHEWAYNLTFQAEPAATSKTIYLSCGECGGKLKMKPEQAGKRIKCPKCKKPVSVPKSGK